jgi:hypothetical protein
VRGGRPRVERKRLDLSPRGAQRVEQLTSHVAEGDPPLEVFGSVGNISTLLRRGTLRRRAPPRVIAGPVT